MFRKNLNFIAIVLTIIFVTLKLGEFGKVANWSWIWVLSPAWITVLASMLITITVIHVHNRNIKKIPEKVKSRFQERLEIAQKRQQEEAQERRNRSRQEREEIKKSVEEIQQEDEIANYWRQNQDEWVKIFRTTNAGRYPTTNHLIEDVDE